MSKNELLLELISELTKKNVQLKKIQPLCQRLKIPFNGDVVELMTLMLGSGMISQNLKTQSKTKKTSHDQHL